MLEDVIDIDRYSLSITFKEKTAITTGNDLDALLVIYNTIVQENITTDEDVIVAIFDYNKNTNIYYYDSTEER